MELTSTTSSMSEIFQSVASEVGVSRADVELMNSRLSHSDLSLNAPLVDRDNSTTIEHMELLVDDRPLPDQYTETTVDSERRTFRLAEALKLLSERERFIVREHYLNNKLSTLGSIGADLGITKERVRQIENSALLKLRESMNIDIPRHS
jgi:RNA polymerase sigma-32 factor